MDLLFSSNAELNILIINHDEMLHIGIYDTAIYCDKNDNNKKRISINCPLPVAYQAMAPKKAVSHSVENIKYL